MHKAIIASIAVLIAFSIGAAAIEWEETSRGSDVVLNTGTGLPAVVFSATVEYSELPASYHLEGGWDVYEIVGSTRVPIEASPSTAFLRGSTLTISTATSQIPIEVGKKYGATLSLQDTVNDLTYQRTFTYTPVAVLPMGISLRGWDGSEQMDLSALPDEELEQLVLLNDLLKRYKQYPVEKTAVSFLREDAAAQPDTAVLLNGELGVGEEIDRCTYSACGEGCCSTCIEHEEEEETAPPEEAPQEPAADVRIECIVYQGTQFGAEADEYVQIKNYGTASQDLLGWTLVNQNKKRFAFTFPTSYLLEPGMSIRVYTNEIHDDWGGFSFESEEAIWTNVVQYPVSLILLPMPPGTISSSSGTGIRFTVVLTLYTYTLSSRNDIALVQSQLAQFDQAFNGSIYVGSGSDMAGGGKTIFVHDIAMQMLEAAASEMRNR